MKKFNSFLAGSFMLSASLFLFSCKKQVSHPLTDDVAASLSLEANNENMCRAVLFGVYAERNNGENEWTTFAQKWYAGGRLLNLKAQTGGPGYSSLSGIETPQNLEWGEMIYEGNQVYLRDVLNNRTVMRVTLDDQGRPAASYYHNITAHNSYMKDTTYYYYTGSRLDSIVRFYETFLYPPRAVKGWDKFKFVYDSYGNMTMMDGFHNIRRNLFYDYTKPVTGVISDVYLTNSFKIMEYMDLVKIPMHHALVVTQWGYFLGPPRAGEFHIILRNEYQDYTISDGRVHSYVIDYGSSKYTFYNGWECEAGTPGQELLYRQKNTISSLGQFLEAYPVSQ